MIAVLKKMFLILEAFSKLGDPQPLAQLTVATGLPKPTVYRLVQSMVALGYLAQDARTGQYMRTPAIERLGTNSNHGYLLQRTRLPMESLRQQFDETVSLAVLAGTDVYYLSVMETSRTLRRIPPENNREPYHVTASGRVIAAHLPPDEQAVLLDRTRLRPLTPRAIVQRPRLVEILGEVRLRGWSFQSEENEEGVCCLAAPIREGDSVAAAIAITVPTIRMNDARKEAMIQSLLAIEA